MVEYVIKIQCNKSFSGVYKSKAAYFTGEVILLDCGINILSSESIKKAQRFTNVERAFQVMKILDEDGINYSFLEVVRYSPLKMMTDLKGRIKFRIYNRGLGAEDTVIGYNTTLEHWEEYRLLRSKRINDD